MNAVIIDTFNNYKLRTQYVYKCLVELGYTTSFLISDFDHIKKQQYVEQRDNAIYIPTIPYKKNLSFTRLYSHLNFSHRVYKELKKLKPDLIYAVLLPYLHWIVVMKIRLI